LQLLIIIQITYILFSGIRLLQEDLQVFAVAL